MDKEIQSAKKVFEETQTRLDRLDAMTPFKKPTLGASPAAWEKARRWLAESDTIALSGIEEGLLILNTAPYIRGGFLTALIEAEGVSTGDYESVSFNEPTTEDIKAYVKKIHDPTRFVSGLTEIMSDFAPFSMKKKNIAGTVAEIMGNDGQKYDLLDGRTLRDVCEEHGATTEVDGDTMKFTFSDESMITDSGSAWDISYADCGCWGGGGHTDECEEIGKMKQPKDVVAVYDNDGESLDRYTLVLDEPDAWTPGCYAGLGLSYNPGDLQGFSQFGVVKPGGHLGRLIKFNKLPLNVQKHAIERLTH